MPIAPAQEAHTCSLQQVLTQGLNIVFGLMLMVLNSAYGLSLNIDSVRGPFLSTPWRLWLT